MFVRCNKADQTKYQSADDLSVTLRGSGRRDELHCKSKVIKVDSRVRRSSKCVMKQNSFATDKAVSILIRQNTTRNNVEGRALQRDANLWSMDITAS